MGSQLQDHILQLAIKRTINQALLKQGCMQQDKLFWKILASTPAGPVIAVSLLTLKEVPNLVPQANQEEFSFPSPFPVSTSRRIVSHWPAFCCLLVGMLRGNQQRTATLCFLTDYV